MFVIADMCLPEEYDRHTAVFGLKRRLEKIAGCPGLVMNFPDVSPERLHGLPVKAVFITGFGYSWSALRPEWIEGIAALILDEASPPILGVCGGHQLIDVVFRGDASRVHELQDQPMRRLAPDEPDPDPQYYPGWFKEEGMFPVEIERDDPLFNGLPRRIMVCQSHYCEVKALPPGFVRLATGRNCRVQAMRHRTRPLYGVQFHPERWTDVYPDGGRVLENFFRLAGCPVGM